MSSPSPSSLALAAATARSRSAARMPSLASSPFASAGLATSGITASLASRTAASASAIAPARGALVAATTARMVRCFAEWRCPAARAPASACAAIHAVPRSASTHPGRLPSLKVL
eukprot:1903124-Pleurochrysis_carterae.AAC.1